MLRPRLIVSLLIDRELHLVKTQGFANRQYIGDPLNAAYIFSGFNVDELLILDIDASLEKRVIPGAFIKSLSYYTSVPICVGGGISSLHEVYELLSMGVERIAISHALDADFSFLSKCVQRFGSSTISVIINTSSSADLHYLGRFGRYGKDHSLLQLAVQCQEAGAGEIIFHDRDREGLGMGFDADLFADLNNVLNIPIVALGGCGSSKHICDLLTNVPTIGVAAGSQFVFAPKTRHVLLNYPDTSDLFSSIFANLHKAF